MGYDITYELSLAIRPKHFKRALEIFNSLHSDEMLLAHARGGMSGRNTEDRPVRERKWYSWVNNPIQPYTNLREAFDNWSIVEEDAYYYIDEDTHDFVVRGSYDSKLGQQDFLIEQLAPVLRNTVVEAHGEDGWTYQWKVVNHRFERVEIPPTNNYEFEDEVPSDDEAGFYEPANMQLAGV